MAGAWVAERGSKLTYPKCQLAEKHWKPFSPGLHVTEDTQENPGDSWVGWEWRCLGGGCGYCTNDL